MDYRNSRFLRLLLGYYDSEIIVKGICYLSFIFNVIVVSLMITYFFLTL